MKLAGKAKTYLRKINQLERSSAKVKSHFKKRHNNFRRQNYEILGKRKEDSPVKYKSLAS